MKVQFMRIKITSTPEGKAPIEIRKKWVGLKLNGAAYEPGMIIGPEPDNHPGFITLTDTAILALETHSKKAFEWWSKWRIKHPDSDALIFDSGCYEVIDPERENQQFLNAFKSGPLQELVDYIMKH